MEWLKKIKAWLKPGIFSRARKQKIGDFWVEAKEKDCPGPGPSQDKVTISLAGLEICLSRQMEIDLPHEITIVIPRAEIRKKCPCETCPNCQLEIILSSITISHSPRPLEWEGETTSLEDQF